MSNAKKITPDGTRNIRSESSHVDFYKQSIGQLFNIVILGNEINKCQLDLPLEDNPNGLGRRIGVLNVENTKIRKTLDKFYQIIDLSIVCSDTRNPLSSAVWKHDRSMFILRKKEVDYAFEELIEFKCFTNSFCATTSKIYDRKIFTNYCHVLIVNHVCDCIVEWGNLYWHSQQGWESLNSQIKSFFFRRTNKDGAKINMKRSMLMPIMRLMQLRALWMSSAGDKIIDDHKKDKHFELTNT